VLGIQAVDELSHRLPGQRPDMLSKIAFGCRGWVLTDCGDIVLLLEQGLLRSAKVVH